MSHARTDGIMGAGPGVTYPFADHQILNIDASDIVRAERAGGIAPGRIPEPPPVCGARARFWRGGGVGDELWPNA